jgi:outer membrane protein assembly factor BamC
MKFRHLIVCSALAGLSACSTIKSWFPDKGREYQFTSEIPELVIPADLQASANGKPAAGRMSSPVPVKTDAAQDAAHTASPENTADKDVKDRSDHNVADGGQVQTATANPSQGSSLQIDQDRPQAARMVGKALSRQKIEIIERNVDKGFYYVKFDPQYFVPQDKSFLDEINFIFGESVSSEQEYRVNLQQVAPQLTEVTVEDNSGKALSNNAANALLRLITESIKQNPSDTGAEAANPATAEANAPQP